MNYLELEAFFFPDANGSATLFSATLVLVGSRTSYDQQMTRLTVASNRTQPLVTLYSTQATKMYYSGWNLVLTLVVALLCGESEGLWPFTSVHAALDSPGNVYPDTNAKRVAIIGT